MCPAIPLDFIGTDAWNAMAHRIVSVGFKVATLVRSQLAKAQLANALWRFDRLLSAFLKDFYEHVEKGIKADPPPTAKEVRSAIDTMKLIHVAVDRIDTGLRAAGFSNHGLVAGPLKSLCAHADDILDLAESVELMLNPDPLNTVFDASLDELRRGETVGLESIN